MRTLLPAVVPDQATDLPGLYVDVPRTPPEDRPWVLANMVATVDGAASLEGRTGSLGGQPDRLVFRLIRSIPDVILVGAETVRAERYGPIRADEASRAARRARGQAPVARLAIVSGSLALDPASELFQRSEERPLVYTGAEPHPERRAALEAVAEVVPVPARADGSADLPVVLADLRRRGAGVVLTEGGPNLLGQLSGLGLVDEWCVTVAPVVVGGPAARICHTDQAAAPAGLELVHLVEEDGVLLLRYLRPA